MKVTIELNEKQALNLAEKLSYEWGTLQDNQFPRTDSANAYWERIRLNILKGIAKARIKANS